MSKNKTTSTVIWESKYDIKEFDGPFKVGFDWEGKRYEFEIKPEELDLEQDEDSWFHDRNTGQDGQGNKVSFEVWGTRDVFGNIRTSGPCIVHGAGVTTACLAVNVILNGNVIEQIDDVDIL